MVSINAKELHHNTGKALDRLEKGETILITRNGRVIAKAEPAAPPQTPDWKEIMAEVWKVRKTIPAGKREANPVIQERSRRRR
jgi:antitoxin (DNA-binding transcriptional repressor) of toxin-antitoxin stability system